MFCDQIKTLIYTKFFLCAVSSPKYRLSQGAEAQKYSNIDHWTQCAPEVNAQKRAPIIRPLSSSLCILEPLTYHQFIRGKNQGLNQPSARVGGYESHALHCHQFFWKEIQLLSLFLSPIPHFSLGYLVHKLVTKGEEKSKLDSRKKAILAFLTIFHTKGNRSCATGIFGQPRIMKGIPPVASIFSLSKSPNFGMRNHD